MKQTLNPSSRWVFLLVERGYMFPFKDVPTKDSNKVHFDFIRVTSKAEQKLIMDYLHELGFIPINETMNRDDPRTLAIPLNNDDRVYGYAGIHVIAEQVYHGAKIYYGFLAYKEKKCE